jgi:hypothetical protein
VANRSGLARDRAARYQVAVRELAAARGWSVLPPKLSKSPTLSTHPVETGIFFKRHVDAAFLEAASGDEVLMLAEPDVFGRHRVAFSKASGNWASIAVHGAGSASATNLIQANIHAATDFAKLARGKGAYLLFTTTLNPAHSNRWTPYRIPTSQAAAAFQSALHGSAARRVA